MAASRPIVLGSPQIVEKLDGSTYNLHDPFLSTVLDFIRRALDQLACALHVVVVHTKYHRAIVDRDQFFKGQNGYFVNPSKDPSGHDVYYLLKNLSYFADVYAKALRVDSEDLTETVHYLLQTIRNHIAHQSYLGCERNDDISLNPHSSLRKYSTTQECLDECIKLLEWFGNASFYNNDEAKVRRIQRNLINMKAVVADHQRHKEAMKRAKKAMKRAKDQAPNTQRAKDFLQRLLRDLTAEEHRGSDEQPITHAVNMILAPRIQRE